MNLFNLRLVLTILKILADVGRNAHHLRVEVINTLNASTRLLHAILAVSATTGNHAAVAGSAIITPRGTALVQDETPFTKGSYGLESWKPAIAMNLQLSEMEPPPTAIFLQNRNSLHSDKSCDVINFRVQIIDDVDGNT